MADEQSTVAFPSLFQHGGPPLSPVDEESGNLAAAFSLRPLTTSSPPQLQAPLPSVQHNSPTSRSNLLPEQSKKNRGSSSRRGKSPTPPPSHSTSSSPPLSASAFLPSSGSRRARSSTPDALVSASLVADVQTARSRLLITKTHILYPPPSLLAPYPRQAVLAFRLIYHPLSQSRIKDSEISIRLLPILGTSQFPIIKAIFPQNSSHFRHEPTQVTRTRRLSGSLSLGIDPYGRLQLAASDQVEATYSVRPNIRGSGVETNVALFTLNEDPVSHAGVEPSLDLAVLLQLPETDLREFEAEISVSATESHAGLQEAIRRAIGSPRAWRLSFDGVTETGQMQIGTSQSLATR